MANWHRGSEGPVPAGPSNAPAEPGERGADGDPTPPGTPSPTPDAAPPIAPGPPPPPMVGSAYEAPPAVAQWAPPPGAYGIASPESRGLQYGRTLDRLMAYWLDGFIVEIPVLVAVVLLSGFGGATGLRIGGVTLVAGILALGIHLLYFVSFWTGGARATIGMRLMKLQIADAGDGATLTVQQGLVRWLAIGGAFQVVQLVPALALVGVLMAVLWSLVLLASTATSPTRQGIHDRIAGSALVQPRDAQTPAMTCLAVVVVLFGLWLLAIVSLVLLGGQISSILSNIGSSV